MKDIIKRASALLRHFSAVTDRIAPLMRRMSEAPFSYASLGKLFAVVFLASLVIQLPASLGMRLFQPQGLYAQSVSGRLWDIRLEKLVYMGRQWSTAQFQPAILPLVIGRFGGDFSLAGAGGVFSGSIKHAGSDKVAFHRLDGKFRTYFQSAGVNSEMVQVPVTITFEGRKLDLDKNGTCYNGTAMLTLSTNNAFAGSLLPASQMWRGTAACVDGMMSFNLVADTSQTTKIDNIRIAGTLKAMRLTADVIVRLPEANENDDVILNILRLSGFEAHPDGWALPLEGRL